MQQLAIADAAVDSLCETAGVPEKANKIPAAIVNTTIEMIILFIVSTFQFDWKKFDIF